MYIMDIIRTWSLSLCSNSAFFYVGFDVGFILGRILLRDGEMGPPTPDSHPGDLRKHASFP